MDPADAVAYVCGNPDAVASIGQVLRAAGLPTEAVRTELYWS